MVGISAQPAPLQLLWVSGGVRQRCGAHWHHGLAPEIEISAIEPSLPRNRRRGPSAVRVRRLAEELADTCLAVLDGRPCAIAGYGPWALVGFELACLLRGSRAPMHLLVAGCPAPARMAADPTSCRPSVAWGADRGEHGDVSVDLTLYRPSAAAVSCSVTAFAAPDPAAAADQLCSWRTATSGMFSLRLLPADPAAWHRPDTMTLLAIKEELRVWPG
jgi:surfactin synthase thioesterase subunit